MTAVATAVEDALADQLAGLLAEVIESRVPRDAHFFADLGADSLLMARFCARVRASGDLPAVSIKQVYQHPTVAALATALALAPGDARPQVQPSLSIGEPPAPSSTRAYVACGIAQLFVVFGYAWLVALGGIAAASYVAGGSGPFDVYLRGVLAGSLIFATACVVPVLAKWLLVGRWRATRIRVWSPAYLRFWMVKTLVRTNPLVLFAGTPLYVLYLRALGARIGPGALVLTQHVPVCTDLLEIGADAVVRKDSYLSCYRAEAGWIHVGPVTVGRGAVVGESTVLEIGTCLGDAARLGHSSSLRTGQAVDRGDRRNGWAAAEHTGADLGDAEPRPCRAVRRVRFSLAQLLALLGLRLPAVLAVATLAVSTLPPALLAAAPVAAFAGGLLVILLVALTVPRVLNAFLHPGRTYRLYGVHHWCQRAIARLTNVPFFPRALGDSSYVVWYLRRLGYNLDPVVQTGSNFGLEVKHDNPFLCRVGTGTMVADGLSMINVDYTSTSFRLSPVAIGDESFLGNYIAWPAGATVGEDVLIGTKAMVPVDGEVRNGTGLLGSPPFPIPRSVLRDRSFDHFQHGEELRRRLRAKNRHNAITIGLYLLSWCTYIVELTALAAPAAWMHSRTGDLMGATGFAAAAVLGLALGVAHFTLVERIATGFRTLQPRLCSIYDPDFWWHERFWKLAWQPLLLDGTPFKSLTWRLLGVRIGRRVFDDGCAIVEKSLVTVGDDCTLNVRSVVQPHSQESGTFKSDHVSIGAGCTLGIASLVHYGATLGDGSVLEADSFLMKGEQVPAHTRWAGNPARQEVGSR